LPRWGAAVLRPSEAFEVPYFLEMGRVSIGVCWYFAGLDFGRVV